jgi:hypothetical protein
LTPTVLRNDARSAFSITPRSPGDRFNENVDLASGRYREKSETKKAAKLLNARVLLPAATAARRANGEPDLIAGRRAIDPLQDQFEGKGELQLADNNGAGLALTQSHKIAPAYLALSLEAELFEEALDGKVKA